MVSEVIHDADVDADDLEVEAEGDVDDMGDPFDSDSK